MTTLTRSPERAVAKSKPEPFKKPERTISVKLPESIVITARVIAGLENALVSNVIAECARECLDRREREAMEARAKTRDGKK